MGCGLVCEGKWYIACFCVLIQVHFFFFWIFENTEVKMLYSIPPTSNFQLPLLISLSHWLSQTGLVCLSSLLEVLCAPQVLYHLTYISMHPRILEGREVQGGNCRRPNNGSLPTVVVVSDLHRSIDDACFLYTVGVSFCRVQSCSRMIQAGWLALLGSCSLRG